MHMYEHVDIIRNLAKEGSTTHETHVCSSREAFLLLNKKGK